MNVPYTDKNPTTVKEMKNNITVADTATVSVLNGGTELADKDAVAAGMTLRITAEDGTTNDYTIGQKNTYNWTLDYVNGQQGNVWFGQMKNGTWQLGKYDRGRQRRMAKLVCKYLLWSWY